MPQPVSYNTGTPVSGSIQESSISYVVDGQQRDYRGGYSGLSWMSEAPATNNVIFIGNSNNVGRGPANTPLFYPSFNNSDANIIYAANKLPGSPGTFNTTTDAYDWAIGNNFFINNSNNPIPRIDADGLIFYVDANQPGSYPGINNTGYDISGNGFNGDLLNGTNWNSGGWFEFDGADDRIRTLFGLQNNNESHEAWIYSKGNVSTYNMFMGIILPYYGFYNGNTFIVQDSIGGAQVGYFTGTLSLNRWYHFLSTRSYNGTNTTLTTYINGTLSAQQTFSGAPSNAGGTWAIGNWDAPAAGASYPFYGDISDVKIYTQTLNEAQVKQNYLQSNIVQDGLVFMVDANNLVSYPKSGIPIYNLTGSIVSGSLINGPTFSPTNGGSIIFDGVDDYINYQNNINPISSFSCEAWINFSSTSLGGSDTPILAKWSSASAPSKNFIFGYRNTGGQKGISFYLYDSSYNQQDNYRIDWDPIPNKWYHIVGVFSASNYVKIYIDSIEDYSRTSGVYSSLNPNSTENLTSGYATGLTYFPGRIANTRIYSKALSPSEIQQNYQATKDKFLGQNIVTSGLVLNLDSANKDSYPGTGTTWYDLSGNANNGTLINGPSFLPNVNSGIIKFDGVDDYIDGGTSTLSSGNISLFQWVKMDSLSSTGWNITFTKWLSSVDFHFAIKSETPRLNLYTTSNSDLYANTALATGVWYYVGFTLVNGGTLTFYVNGTSDGTYGSVSRTPSNDTIYIGDPRPNYGLAGSIPITQVYNRALSTAEVLQNYNATKIRFGL